MTMAIRLIHVVCAECGAETNKIEYDPNGRAAKIDQVAAALGIDTAAAETYVDQHGADPAAAAKALAATLTDDTISPCPNGHTGQLQVAE